MVKRVAPLLHMQVQVVGEMVEEVVGKSEVEVEESSWHWNTQGAPGRTYSHP